MNSYLNENTDNRNLVGTYESKQTQATLNLSKVNAILLETARAKVMSINKNKSADMIILFDSGSQMSYITP